MISLKDIFTMSEEEVLLCLDDELHTAGYHPYSAHDDGYIWAPGDIPIILIAHVDCVSGHAETVFHDPAADVFWSPDGLGADDRAGVWGILYLIEQGYRPSILFTDGEERGGWGARAAARVLSPAIARSDVRALVEIDRQGSMEAVYYGCGNDDIREWIEGAGFREDYGTFSDISILGPAWDIAAVNLSAGYYMEHSIGEYLIVDHLLATLARVAVLLENPPPSAWPHETKAQQGYSWLYGGSRRPLYDRRGTFYNREYLDDYEDFSYDEWLKKSAVMEPVDNCCLCESSIWDEADVRRFDEYPLCVECFREVGGEGDVKR